MPVIPQRELRNNYAQVLREVRAGAVYTITDRGKPIAQLAPLEQHPLDQAIAAGNAQPAAAPVRRAARLAPREGSPPSEEIIRADRDGR